MSILTQSHFQTLSMVHARERGGLALILTLPSSLLGTCTQEGRVSPNHPNPFLLGVLLRVWGQD